MNRGFALLAVLWLVALLGGAVLAAGAGSRAGVMASHNRLDLVRARWAAEACASFALARLESGGDTDSDAVNLGRGTRCRWAIADTGARVNLNAASRAMLQRFLAGSLPPESARALADSIVVRRARAPLLYMGEVPELPPALAPLVTVEGEGRVNVNSAPAEVLAAVPGMTSQAVTALLRRRLHGGIGSLGDIVAELSRSGRDALLASFAEAARATTVRAEVLSVAAVGWVERGAPSPTARLELLVLVGSPRLAVVRRRIT